MRGSNIEILFDQKGILPAMVSRDYSRQYTSIFTEARLIREQDETEK